jgi:hypothetical protein
LRFLTKDLSETRIKKIISKWVNNHKDQLGDEAELKKLNKIITDKQLDNYSDISYLDLIKNEDNKYEVRIGNYNPHTELEIKTTGVIDLTNEE